MSMAFTCGRSFKRPFSRQHGHLNLYTVTTSPREESDPNITTLPTMTSTTSTTSSPIPTASSTTETVSERNTTTLPLATQDTIPTANTTIRLLRSIWHLARSFGSTTLLIAMSGSWT